MKRFVAFVLAFCLVFGPVASFADASGEQTNEMLDEEISEEVAEPVEEEVTEPVVEEEVAEPVVEEEPVLEKQNKKINPAIAQYTLEFYWKTKTHSSYNPQDKGKKELMSYNLVMEGTNSQTGQRVEFIKTYQTEVEIGTDFNVTIDTANIVGDDGNSYNDIVIVQSPDPVPGKTSRRLSFADSFKLRDPVIKISLHQNANTDINEMKVAKGKEIYSAHRDAIDIKASFLETYKGNTEEFRGKNGHIIHGIFTFEDDGHIYLMDVDSKVGSESSDVEYAVFGNSMKTWSPYTGKYMTYQLKADFFKIADLLEAEFSKYYQDPKVSGNDQDGWLLTITPKYSKILAKELRVPNLELEPGEERMIKGNDGYILDETGEVAFVEKKDTIIEYGPEELPFDTIRKPNIELKPGEEKVVTEGVVGRVDENGNVLVEKVDQVIEYGPAVKDDTPKLPNTGESRSNQLQMIAILFIVLGFVLYKKKEKYSN